jgi:hypothetical protein
MSKKSKQDMSFNYSSFLKKSSSYSSFLENKKNSLLPKEKTEKVKYLEKVLDTLNKEEKCPNKNINILLKFHHH